MKERLEGVSGRRYTGESSEGSSVVGTPTDTGRCFTFTATQRVLREERKPSLTQNLSEVMLEVFSIIISFMNTYGRSCDNQLKLGFMRTESRESAGCKKVSGSLWQPFCRRERSKMMN